MGAADTVSRGEADIVGRFEARLEGLAELLPELDEHAVVEAVSVGVAEPNAFPCWLLGCSDKWGKGKYWFPSQLEGRGG